MSAGNNKASARQADDSTGVTVRPMRTDEAGTVAELHRVQLAEAFLSTLGRGFLTQLYRGIAASPCGFVFVAVDKRDRIVGFVSGATDTGALQRWMLRRRGVVMGLYLLRHLLRPSVIRRVWERLRYPGRVEGDFPDAELLSIGVCADMQGKGVAPALLEELTAEFRRRNVRDIRVVVGAQLGRANAFYRKFSFEQVGTIESHRRTANVYVLKVIES